MKMIPKGFQQLHLSKYNETYEIKAPTVCVRGLLVGRPFLDLMGDAFITCKETGLMAKIHFKDKVNLSLFSSLPFVASKILIPHSAHISPGSEESTV